MIIYLQREITNNRLVLQKNMPIFLNFTAGSILPENELASLRYIVQQNQNDTVIIKERYKMDIRYIESVNGFTVNPVCSNHFSIFMTRQNTIARNRNSRSTTDEVLHKYLRILCFNYLQI